MDRLLLFAAFIICTSGVLNAEASAPETTGIPSFADADGDGIPDADDPKPQKARGKPPVVEHVNRTDARVMDALAGDKLVFVISVRNPAGPAPGPADLTFHASGVEQTVDVKQMGGGKFAVTWNATTHAGYPSEMIQYPAIRFRDAEQATAWVDLGKCDVAEWKGMVAGFRLGLRSQPGPVVGTRPHHGGRRGIFMPLYDSNSGRAFVYRGPRKMSLFIEGADEATASVEIPATARYPLFFISAPEAGPVIVKKTADVSDPIAFPHDGLWIDNRYSDSVKISFDGEEGKTALPGETHFVPIMERTQNGPAVIGFSYHKGTIKGEALVSSSSWGLVTCERTGRRMNLVNFAGSGNRPGYTGQMLILPVEASVIPHAAGPPDTPGLPLPAIDHAGFASSGKLSLVPNQYHKLVIRVGPDAGALSGGIGLWLRRGESGDADPQRGFSLERINADGKTEPLDLPADGRINAPASSELYREITSSEGLVLFVKRAPSVKEAHCLSVELLKKREWYEAPSQRTVALVIGE